MANNVIQSVAAMTSVITLGGMDFSTATSLTTGIFPCYSPYLTSTNFPNMSGINLATAGTPQGAGTITTSYYQVNTGGTDKILLPLNDFGAGAQQAPDMTFFVVVANTASTPNFAAISNYGNDQNNIGNVVAKGVNLAATTATTVAFKDFHTVAGTTSQVQVSVTVPALASGFHCYAFQRGTAAGNVTRNIFDCTTNNGIITPTGSATLTDANPASNNITQEYYIGGNSGGLGAACQIAFVLMIQSGQGGGAFLSLAQMGQIYPRIKAQMAALTTPVVC